MIKVLAIINIHYIYENIFTKIIESYPIHGKIRCITSIIWNCLEQGMAHGWSINGNTYTGGK
ncbi:MAG: hypothetical protein JWR76_2230 [Mucilaginibacter sp.]|nr:hypothetical protein [Mucilaginibacter sp.]